MSDESAIERYAHLFSRPLANVAVDLEVYAQLLHK